MRAERRRGELQDVPAREVDDDGDFCKCWRHLVRLHALQPGTAAVPVSTAIRSTHITVGMVQNSTHV